MVAFGACFFLGLVALAWIRTKNKKVQPAVELTSPEPKSGGLESSDGKAALAPGGPGPVSDLRT